MTYCSFCRCDVEPSKIQMAYSRRKMVLCPQCGGKVYLNMTAEDIAPAISGFGHAKNYRNTTVQQDNSHNNT